MDRVGSQNFMDGMPGSHPASRNASLHGGTAFFSSPKKEGGGDTVPMMEGKHLGPNFARKMNQYGQNSFSGAVAKKYLMQMGIPVEQIDSIFEDAALLVEHQDLVAAAVLQWAKEREGAPRGAGRARARADCA